MSRVFIWTPESDYDGEAVQHIANKIIAYYQLDTRIKIGKKQAFNKAVKENKLKEAVSIYLKNHDKVVFLLDADGVQSQANRRRQPNSLINQVESAVKQYDDRVQLIFIKQELEAWLLVDVLGICCFFLKSETIRKKETWIKFARKYQKGKTELITEAEAGGRGVKEYLQDISIEIRRKNNPRLKEKDLKKGKYSENLSPEVAKYIDINDETIKRNSSLEEFAAILS